MYIFLFVGNGMGPLTTAPDVFTVFTIFSADWSTKLWSNDFNFILTFCAIIYYCLTPVVSAITVSAIFLGAVWKLKNSIVDVALPEEIVLKSVT